MTRTPIDLDATVAYVHGKAVPCPDDLLSSYRRLIGEEQLDWHAAYRVKRVLGAGGQGTVFLCERRGSDGFVLPIALKVFSPQPYSSALSYTQDMARIAHLAARVSRIAHDNLLDVQDFVIRDGFRVMVMEWIDGFDLRELLRPQRLEAARQAADWDYLNKVVVTAGACQSRLKPGVAVQVVRDCLAGLTSLHREGIVHGDLKPSNVMLKRTGTAKVIDIGSAVDLSAGSERRAFSPIYAAPEVLEGERRTPRSDLASLGYMLVEMLSGETPLRGSYAELAESKRSLPDRLDSLLPEDVARNRLLVDFCRKLVEADPDKRFATAEEAALAHGGAAEFHRHLVKADLASEYGNDIRVWLEAIE